MTPVTSTSSLRFRWFAGACIALVLVGLAHAGTHIAPEPPMPDSDDQALVRLLSSCRIDLAGTARTCFEINQGFGWLFSLVPITLAAAGFSFLTLSPRPVAPIRQLSVVYTPAMLAAPAVWLVYWFIIPTSFTSATLALLPVSLWRAGRTPA